MPNNYHKEIEEDIQKDLDNGMFHSICSNETSFKKYVLPKLSLAYKKGKAEQNLKIAELIGKYALETKDIKTLDLLEKIQKEVLSTIKK